MWGFLFDDVDDTLLERCRAMAIVASARRSSKKMSK